MKQYEPDLHNSTKVIILVVFFMAIYWTDLWYPDLPFVPSVITHF